MTNYNEPEEPKPDYEPSPEQQQRQLARVNKYGNMNSKAKRKHKAKLRKKAKKDPLANQHLQECMIVDLAVIERRHTANQPQAEANAKAEADRLAMKKANAAIRESKLADLFKEQTDNGNLRNRMKGENVKGR